VHEAQKRTCVAVPNDATEDLAGADVESRKQRACPAPPVLELVPDYAMTARMDG
jgi:hypothetical protein